MHESMTQDGLPCTSSAPHGGKRTRAQLRQLASVSGATCKWRSRPEGATFEKDKDFLLQLRSSVFPYNHTAYSAVTPRPVGNRRRQAAGSRQHGVCPCARAGGVLEAICVQWTEN